MRYRLLLICMMPVISLAQRVDVNFEDNDLTSWFQSTPNHWEISGIDALNGNYSLRHAYNDSVAGSDWIALFHNPHDFSTGQVSWEFTLAYDYLPSSNNNWSVFLAADNLPIDETSIRNAIIVGVNYTGSSDELGVWQIGDGKLNQILKSSYNWEEQIQKSQKVKFRITYEAQNLNLEIDTSGNSWFSVGSVELGKMPESSYFLVNYKYSSTYDMGLHLDDLRIFATSIQPENSPKVEWIQPLSSNKLHIAFSSIVEIESGSEFCVDEVGCVLSDATIGKECEIDLPYLLTPGKVHGLNLPNIQSMQNVDIEDSNRRVQFYYPGAYDLVINEIMADPSPSVLLPEYEYLELYNTTDYAIQISGWLLSVNKKYITLPHYVLPAKGYLLLCDTDADSTLRSLKTDILSIEYFPQLTNEGAEVVLYDANGRLIHAVNYSTDLHSTSEKRQGGWSLEMRDPLSPCIIENNWISSTDYRGGTPGEANSVLQLNSITTKPEIWRVAISDSNWLTIYFSEPMDSLSISNRAIYFVDRGFGSPSNVKTFLPLAYKVGLYFTEIFKSGVEYEFTITTDPCNCSGIQLQQSSFVFQYPVTPNAGDIIINEIMFDPADEMNEYIELYNTSGNTIDLKNYRICTGTENVGEIITNENFPVASNNYIVLSGEIRGIDRAEVSSFPQKIVKMPDFPILINEGNSLSLFDSAGLLLDEVNYFPNCHHPLISDSKGVSLERISPVETTLDCKNWQSASGDAGYKSPAAMNTQHQQVEETEIVTLTPATISPNNDGVDDELSICYSQSEPGRIGRVFLFNTEGIKMVEMANGALLGAEGCFTFEGRDAKGKVLSPGFYIVYFESVGTNQKKYSCKKTFVVAQ